ncbi:MAG: HlyD family secretion protein, partial [Thermodesulforhabdaceae bacterium]
MNGEPERSSQNASKTQSAVNAVKNSNILKKILVGFVGALIIGVAVWWYYSSRYVSTDNAYVVADSATVSSRIPGRIIKVYVENDDPVKEGALLLELDPADYEMKVKEAEAALKALQEEYNLHKANLAYIETTMTANVDSARAALNMAKDRE